MLERESLNDYSAKVFDYLKKNHPELLEFSKIYKSDFGKNYLSIEIETPNKESASNLILDTEDDQITIGFHCFHSHFDNFNELDFENEIKSATNIFNKILNEELLIVSGELMTVTEVDNLEKGELVGKTNREKINYYVVSWSGKYDKEFENLNFINYSMKRMKSEKSIGILTRIKKMFS
ncbi:hypothetical protein [Tenacibaculum sp. E3R01]|uniref:hypothetical protein n=1 Tax=Tenacibaculum sp. E3R01 TaxID=2267227 RepID=UPI0011BFBF98|nr:hypothetical protein [Tenacibaculum sp. E3R01]